MHIHIHARTPDGDPELRGRGLRRDHATRSATRSATGRSSTSRPGRSACRWRSGSPTWRRCGPEVAALNMGSMNYAKYSRKRKDFVFKFVFANPFDEIIELLEAMRRLQIKPEHECFDLGHVGSLAPLVDMGAARGAAARGLRDGRGRRRCRPTRAQPRRDGRQQVPAAGHAPLGRDRDLRATSGCWWPRRSRSAARSASGLEDNFYLPDGAMARSNGDLIAKARQMTEDARPPPGDGGRGARAAGRSRPRAAEATPHERACRSTGCGSSISRGCCRAGSARCCWPTSAPT